MCKIAILTHHNPKQLSEIIQALWTDFSISEKDGFGATWISPSGKLVYLKSSTPSVVGNSLPKFVEGFYTLSDKLESNGGSLLVHARTATCDVNLENCHPMLSGTSALIHNGVVSSKHYKNSKRTSCDSELLLNAWKHGVKQGNSIDNIADCIQGYYAFGILSATKQGEILDVVRDSRASLYCGQTEQGYCFSTTREGVRISGGNLLGEFSKNTHAQFIDGNLIKTQKFNPYIPPVKDYGFERQASRAFADYKPYSYERGLLPEETDENLYTDAKLQGL